MGIDLAKLKELAERATPGPWTLYVPENYQGPEELPGYGVECAEGRAIIWGALEPETGCQFDRDAEFIAAANPQAILGLIAEVERLRARLEIDDRTPYDGIACRDETIKGLDEKCDRLKRQVDMLINQHMPREPIPDMPGWTRVIDADRLKAENEALRSALEAFVLRADAYMGAGRGMPDVSMEVVLEKARAAL